MAVNSTSLGAAKVSGNEAVAFARKIAHARGSKAASTSAQNGRALTSAFAKKGVVTLKLKKSPAAK